MPRTAEKGLLPGECRSEAQRCLLAVVGCVSPVRIPAVAALAGANADRGKA